MKIIPAKIWSKKGNTILVYVGRIVVGAVEPSKTNGDLYSFYPSTKADYLYVKPGQKMLQAILDEIDLSMKEFVSQITNEKMV